MKNQMNGLADQAETKINHMARDAKNLASEAGREARNFAGEAQDIAEEGMRSFRNAASTVRDQAEEVWKRSDEVLKANPYYFVAGTAIVGLTLGYLLGRSRSH